MQIDRIMGMRTHSLFGHLETFILNLCCISIKYPYCICPTWKYASTEAPSLLLFGYFNVNPSSVVREVTESHLEYTFLLWYPCTHLQPVYVSTSWSQTVNFDPKHYTWAGAPALKRGSGFNYFQQVKTNWIVYLLFLFWWGQSKLVFYFSNWM